MSFKMAAVLMAAVVLLAPLAAADEPAGAAATATQTFGSTLKAGAISGFWKAVNPSINSPEPIAYVAAITQGRTVSFTGGFNTDPATPITGAGYYVNTAWAKGGNQLKIKSASPSHLISKYPVYQAFFATGSETFSGWYTLVLADSSTVIPYPGEDPEIPFPPVAAPGQPILKRVTY